MYSTKPSCCNQKNDEKFTKFKVAFKYYKQKDLLPDLKHVIDLTKADEFPADVEIIELSSNCKEICLKNAETFGFNDHSKWKGYSIKKIPGLYFIQNLFTESGERLWCQKAVEDLPKEPQKTNLLVNYPQEFVNESYETSVKICEDNEISGWFSPKKQLKVLKSCPIWPLRWATLGYHYKWTEREYVSNRKSEFPKDIADLTKIIANIIGFKDFIPEAGITNYYHVGQNISPHVDISEPHKQAPLVSVSFGLPAIFLIGTDDLNIKPEAIFIRSGDVLIMSGKSRLAYHAVPAVLSQHNELKTACDFLSLYMAHTQININVRQVESDDLNLKLPNIS